MTTPEQASGPDAAALRSALGRYATGVTVITCRTPEGQRVGLTANSFAALSLEPPLVLWSLRTGSATRPLFDAAGHFAVNVLTERQLPLSNRFASREVDKFAEGEWTEGEAGSPLLAGALAQFDCVLHARHELGDHVLYVGRVLRLTQSEGVEPPLLFQGGGYRSLGGAV